MKTIFYNSKNAPKPNKPIHLGATAFIIHNDKVLLEKRSDSDRWAFIGGGLKMDESLETCIIREIFEETGLKVDTLHLLDVFSYPYRIAAYPDGNIVRIVTALFKVIVPTIDNLICSKESIELQFFDKDELLSLSIAETHLDLLKYYVDHF